MSEPAPSPGTSSNGASDSAPVALEAQRAWRALRCCVAIDLRVRGAAGAVAVDRRGRPQAWAWVRGPGQPAELAIEAAQWLGVRFTEIRVLLGAPLAQTANAQIEDPLSREAVRDALSRHGGDLAPNNVAHLCAPDEVGGWVASVCPDDEVSRLVDRLIGGELGLEGAPRLTVDLAFLAASTPPGRALIEGVPTRRAFNVTTFGAAGGRRVRRVPAELDDLAAPDERALDLLRRTLAQAGVAPGDARALGSGCAALAERLGAEKPAPLPAVRDKRLPVSLELAWRLAAAPPAAIPALDGSALRRRRAALTRDRRLVSIGILVFAVGLGLFVLGQRQRSVARARLVALQGPLDGASERLRIEARANRAQTEIYRLESKLRPLEPTWPALAPTLLALERLRPEGIGFERVSVQDAVLRLDASAAGAAAATELLSLRRILQTSSRLANVTWSGVRNEGDELALMQRFGARVTDPEAPPPGQGSAAADPNGPSGANGASGAMEDGR